MRFEILIPETVELPGEAVLRSFNAIREIWARTGSPNADVPVQEVLNWAVDQGLITLPRGFKADNNEKRLVTKDEIAKAIEDESKES
jgi:hypothetical protein